MKKREFLGLGAAWGLAPRIGAEANQKFRVAVIGHMGRGDFGHELDVMWGGVPGAEVVAVADPVAEGLGRAVKRVGGGVRGFLDYRKMLGEVSPEIVAVAPRHADQHEEMVLAAVEGGARGIYVEKPFARTFGPNPALRPAKSKG